MDGSGRVGLGHVECDHAGQVLGIGLVPGRDTPHVLVRLSDDLLAVVQNQLLGVAHRATAERLFPLNSVRLDCLVQLPGAENTGKNDPVLDNLWSEPCPLLWVAQDATEFLDLCLSWGEQALLCEFLVNLAPVHLANGHVRVRDLGLDEGVDDVMLQRWPWQVNGVIVGHLHKLAKVQLLKLFATGLERDVHIALHCAFEGPDHVGPNSAIGLATVLLDEIAQLLKVHVYQLVLLPDVLTAGSMESDSLSRHATDQFPITTYTFQVDTVGLSDIQNLIPLLLAQHAPDFPVIWDGRLGLVLVPDLGQVVTNISNRAQLPIGTVDRHTVGQRDHSDILGREFVQVVRDRDLLHRYRLSRPDTASIEVPLQVPDRQELAIGIAYLETVKSRLSADSCVIAQCPRVVRRVNDLRDSLGVDRARSARTHATNNRSNVGVLSGLACLLDDVADLGCAHV